MQAAFPSLFLISLIFYWASDPALLANPMFQTNFLLIVCPSQKKPREIAGKWCLELCGWDNDEMVAALSQWHNSNPKVETNIWNWVFLSFSSFFETLAVFNMSIHHCDHIYRFPVVVFRGLTLETKPLSYRLLSLHTFPSLVTDQIDWNLSKQLSTRIYKLQNNIPITRI